MGLGVAFGVLLVVELGFRGAVSCFSPLTAEDISNYQDEAAPGKDPTLKMQPHPYMVYTFSSAEKGVNSWGFTFDSDGHPYEEPEGAISFSKRPGTLRVLTLGGSTTAGPEAWPFHLGELLREHTDQSVEILNFGTGGWTSAESMVAFTTLGQSYQPDIVVLHHAVNDLVPLRRAGFRPDYSHYRKPIALERDELGNLKVKNDLSYFFDATFTRMSWLYSWTRLKVSGSESTMYTLHNLSEVEPQEGPFDESVNAEVFQRNIKTVGLLVNAYGGRMVLATMPYRKSLQSDDPSQAQDMDQARETGQGIDRQNQRVESLAASQDWDVVRLHDLMESDRLDFLYTDQVHVTQPGERLKACYIADQILKKSITCQVPSGGGGG